MTTIETYLTFDGNAADAMRFYEQTLGAHLEALMTFADSPMAGQAPPGAENRVMHARLLIGDRAIMASDAMVGHPYNGMHGFALSLTYPSATESQRIFDALAELGEVTMPFQKTFFSEGFGMLVDRFGTPWMINTDNVGA
jgi:PhnB protein